MLNARIQVYGFDYIERRKKLLKTLSVKKGEKCA
jgi:hypothetical protein